MATLEAIQRMKDEINRKGKEGGRWYGYIPRNVINKLRKNKKKWKEMQEKFTITDPLEK